MLILHHKTKVIYILRYIKCETTQTIKVFI